MQENQEVPTSPDAEGHHVFSGWLKAGLPPLEAYDNTEAIRRMAGHNVVLALESLQSAINAHGVEMAELSSKIDLCTRRIEAQGKRIEGQGRKIEAQGRKIEAHDRQITAQGQELSSKLDGLNKIIWTLVAILVTTLLSFLTTAFGLIK